MVADLKRTVRVCTKCGSDHTGTQYQCPKCYAEWSREWRRNNRERAREIVRNYQRRNPDKIKRNDRSHHLRSTYGITVEQYEKLFESQGRRCAICGSCDSRGPGVNFHVDHDHKTGKVRGLLCCNCNFVVGHSLDSPEILMRAADYLNRG